jgi:hypothetical protein
MSEKEPKISQPKGWAVNGCLFTLLTWLFAAMAMLGPILGDCLPEDDPRCPTDYERNLGLVRIGLAAVAINAAGLILLGWLHARRSRRD